MISIINFINRVIKHPKISKTISRGNGKPTLVIEPPDVAYIKKPDGTREYLETVTNSNIATIIGDFLSGKYTNGEIPHSDRTPTPVEPYPGDFK